VVTSKNCCYQCFIQENSLISGIKLICFSWRDPLWRISVIYVDGGDEDSLGSTFIVQRCRHSVEEEGHLPDMLPPPGTFIGYIRYPFEEDKYDQT
jgi:hypothetical protein